MAKEFINRFQLEEPNVLLYIVEVAYGKDPFILTNKAVPRHLQIRTDDAPIWLKESMINCGVRPKGRPHFKSSLV